MQPKKRLVSLDVARGIAILSILFGHMGIASINRVVFTYHVPIFFIITGYFISAKKPMGDFTRNKIRSLLVPYFAISVAICGCAFILYTCVNVVAGSGINVLSMVGQWIFAAFYGEGSPMVKSFPLLSIGAIWFLWAEFWGCVIFRILLDRNVYTRACWVMLLFIFGVISREYIWLLLSFQAGCCAVLFIYCGYLVRKIKDEDGESTLFQEIQKPLLVISVVLWADFMLHFKGYWLVTCFLGRGAVDVIESLFASYCVVRISGKIVRHAPTVMRALAHLGKYSIIFLGAHIIELDLFPWYIISNFLGAHGVGTVLTTCAIIAGKLIWILAVMEICLKVRWLRRIFVPGEDK